MKTAIISQYKAALKMLLNVIDKCPDSLWENTGYDSAYWRIVYHTLFYTVLYLSEHEGKFVRWEKHILNYNTLGLFAHDKKPVVIGTIYSKEELKDYAATIIDSLETVVMENYELESGFSWIKLNKFELHIYNIRHIQHHTGQLIERLHQNGISGINWVGLA